MKRKAEIQANEARVEKWIRWQKRFRIGQVEEALGVDHHIVEKVACRLLRQRKVARLDKTFNGYVYEWKEREREAR